MLEKLVEHASLRGIPRHGLPQKLIVRANRLPAGAVASFLAAMLSISACGSSGSGESTIESPKAVCTGDGCGYITIEKRSGDGCIVLKNRHSRPIDVKINTTFVSYGVIYANSEFVPKYGIGGENDPCIKDFNYSYSAKILN